MKISMDLIKELRETTSAGMADCKKALEEVSGDIEKAKDWLRANGLSKAAKKEGRVTAEGLVSILSNEDAVVLLEVNSETDFVAKNDKFLNLVDQLSALALKSVSNVDELLNADLDGKKVKEVLVEAIATIGENITIRRLEKLSIKNMLLGSYVHNKVTPNVGKIAVAVILEGTPLNSDLPRNLAMHIASADPRPSALSENDVFPADLEREISIFKEEISNSSADKPENVKEKMLDGKIKKFYQEACLLRQSYIMDSSKTVEQVLKENNTSIKAFKYLVLGEGIVKEETDFAAEVAKTLGN